MKKQFQVLLLFCWAGALTGAPSAACASCHRAIYFSYRRTPMALSSGKVAPAAAIERFDRAAFTHAASGFRYRVRQKDGAALSVEFEQTGAGGLRGEKAMPYFVGSGAAARSYLLSSEGFLFVSPVAWYSGTGRWDLGPAYSGYGYPFLTRSVLPGCLTCHASFLNPVEGTQNRFGAPPWGEDGVACERCHGPGEAHIESRANHIVNPAKLAPDRRDSICAQCHLSGEVRVTRAGAGWSSYRPGERLADSLAVFVNRTPRRTVTGHVENLSQSACKRVAQDRLWCGSCHDPHSVPAPSARVGYFRKKCLACHAAGSTKLRPHGDDCIACHMPKGAVADAEHVVFTDHSIPRRPRPPAAPPTAGLDDLVAFGPAPATARDTALAYGIAASRQPALRARAQTLLESAARQSPDDSEVLLYLAEIYRNAGLDDRAVPLYLHAMELDPSQLTASTGLGAIYFQRGQFPEAIRHWQNALRKNPGLILVATNLAMAQWRQGGRAAAQATLRNVIALSPGFKPARDLLEKLR